MNSSSMSYRFKEDLTMKSYRITVNGNTYDVQVEELAAQPVQTTPQSAPQPQAPVQSAAPAAAPQAAASVPSGAGTKVNAPMPGNILDIKVNVGDKVSANQVVVILEAMKMENEIVVPTAGTVTAVNVTTGQAVNAGDVLITVAQ